MKAGFLFSAVFLSVVEWRIILMNLIVSSYLVILVNDLNSSTERV